MNYEKYYTTLAQLGGAEYHLEMMVKCLEQHFDPETRDFETIIALDQAKRFLAEIKLPSVKETLTNLDESIEALSA